MKRYSSLAVCTFALSCVIGFADDGKPAAGSSDEIAGLVAATKSKEADAGMKLNLAIRSLDTQLQNKATAEATAKKILNRKKDFELNPVVEKRIDSIVAEKKPAAAAMLLLQYLRARQTVAEFGEGGVAIGQVEVSDGKLDPESVLAQTPILEGGYFAGEVGDMSKPINFRAAGYLDVAVPLSHKPGEVADVGTVTMKPVPADKFATLKGKVALEIADRGPATMSISLMVPTPNTPHNGYSPRKSWPQPKKVTIEKDGTFSLSGLTPGTYYLGIEAKDHTKVNKRIALAASQEKNEGTIKLRTTDLGYYIGKAAPKTGELAWEKDFKSAMKKATADKKPVMVMMTATWCGPCKMLEKETLNDPWVKHFLSSFVIVKAYEDKEVEEKYGLRGYPTLVFMDSEGKEMHRTVGYMQSLPFLSQCVKAFEKLSIKLPEDLQSLVDKKVFADG